MPSNPRVVVLGGGFAGLAAAQKLAAARNFSRQQGKVTLVDQANHHLFQPLLYQVATGGLSPANIATPLRSVFRRSANVTVICDQAVSVDLANARVEGANDHYPYDYLIFAAGGVTSYFGHDEWRSDARGLKTLPDATTLRQRILGALETAETNPQLGLPTFVIAGGGPTGVEMSGAIAELTRHTLTGEFRRIDPAQTRVVLLEPGKRLLSSYPAELSERAAERLSRLGVEVLIGKSLRQVDGHTVTIGSDQEQESVTNAVVVWAAGIAASPLARSLAEQLNIEPAEGGRLPICNDLTLPGYPNVQAIGDLAYLEDKNGEALPGVAPVAIQQGKHAASNLLHQIQGKPTRPFHYRDYGAMAVIGRGAAVADLRGLKLSGYPAWLAWLFIHLLQLVGYQNRVLVACQWAWNYATRNRSARLLPEPLSTSDRHGQE